MCYVALLGAECLSQPLCPVFNLWAQRQLCGKTERRGRRQTGEKLDKAPVTSDRSRAEQGEDDRMIVWHCAPLSSCPLPGNMF